jgi:hypothetical protein
MAIAFLFLLGILQVKRCRMESVVKRFVEAGRPPVEVGGGDRVRKKYVGRRH